MKRLGKIAFIFIALLVIAICFLIWSFSLFTSETPLDYPDTKWKSEDGAIYFEVFPPVDDFHSHGDAIGTVTSEDGTVSDVMLRVSHHSSLCVQNPVNEYTYEMWKVKEFSQDGFTVEVEILDHRYALHEKNTQIVFKRVYDN